MTAQLLVLVCAAITVASFSCGLTGLGHGIIFQTCWSLMHSWGVEGAGDLRVGVAVSFLMGPVTAAYLGPSAMRGGEVRWELVVALMPGTIIAQYIGNAALTVLNQDILKKALGILFFAFALWRLSIMFRAMVCAKRDDETAFLAELKSRERRKAEAAAAGVLVLDADAAEPHASGTLEVSVSHVSTSAFLVEQDAPSDATIPVHHDCVWPPEASGELVWPVEESIAPEREQEHGRGGERDGAEVAASSSAVALAPRDNQSGAPGLAPGDMDEGASSGSSSSHYRALRQAQVQSLQVQPVDSHDHLSSQPSSDTNSAGTAAPAVPEPHLSSRPASFSPGALWAWLRPWLSQRVFQATLAVGVASGFLEGLFGTGGPPIMMLFACISISKGEVRGTSVWTGLLHIVPGAISLLVFGIFRAEDWPIYVLLPFFCIAGTAAGSKAHAHVDVNAVLMVMQGLVLLSTISLTDALSGEAFGNLMLVAYALVATLGAAFVVYLSSMHYRFLRDRPHLAPLWADREWARKEAKRAAAAGHSHHPLQLLPDGSPADYTSWHE